jgi:hypothetical protein
VRRAGEVGRDDAVEVSEVLVGPGAARGVEAGRDHHAVEPVEARDDGDERGVVGDVERGDDRGGSRRLHERARLLERLPPPAREHETPAVAGGGHGGRAAHAGSGSAHPEGPRPLPRQVAVVVVVRPCSGHGGLPRSPLR